MVWIIIVLSVYEYCKQLKWLATHETLMIVANHCNT